MSMAVFDQLAASLDRQEKMSQLIGKLWLRLEQEQVLLNTALQELAILNTVPGGSHAKWINTWLGERRKREDPFE
jgi:hypothetical protein